MKKTLIKYHFYWCAMFYVLAVGGTVRFESRETTQAKSILIIDYIG